MLATFSKRAGILVFTLSTLFSVQSIAVRPVVRNVVLLSNALSILGGIGLFSAATIDIVNDQNNSTELGEVHKQVAATSLFIFGVGAALEIVSAELSQPKLINRVDEFAIGMTSLGFSLVSAGIWSNNTNAMLAGSVTVSSGFFSRALLLPLLIEKNPANFRMSDKILLGALTIFGNIGGLLMTWSNFETSPYRRQILQAGSYVLGIINPTVFTGLTINLLRSPIYDGAPIA
jgi:hypothetical protein